MKLIIRAIFLLLFAMVQARCIGTSSALDRKQSGLAAPICMTYEQFRQNEDVLNEQISLYKQKLEQTTPYVIGLFSTLAGSALLGHVAYRYGWRFDEAFASNVLFLGLLNGIGSLMLLLVFWDEGTPCVGRITPDERREYQEKLIVLRYLRSQLQRRDHACDS